MRHLDERCEPVKSPFACLRMDFDARQKVRSRVTATNGELVGVHIRRGTSLKDGDHLRCSDGTVFIVRAKDEHLSVVECQSPIELARAAYHLGNRHVRLQVGEGMVSYQSDHVLDAMVEQLGFHVSHRELPFEPEQGAYQRHEGSEPEGSHVRATEASSHSHEGEDHSAGHSHEGGRHSHGHHH